MLESIIASPEVVHYVCKRFGIHMSKKLGQNFLIKRGVVDEMVKEIINNKQSTLCQNS